MSALDDLKPVSKLLVMDLLAQAGFDISDWKHFKGAFPAANPKYCYNWSFEQPGEAVAVCLWHKSLRLEKNKIFYRRKPRAFASVRDEPGASVWNRRDAEFGRNLELAFRQRLPVRVIVLEGRQRNPADAQPRASVVEARLLDPMPWAVSEYNYNTGECLLERRAPRPQNVPVDPPDLELAWFEGQWKLAFIYHRRREAKARREKIAEALRVNRGRLICEVPNCGFDFAERYGQLGVGYAQVHHLQPLSKSSRHGRETKLKDLAVVCANCHTMIHIGGNCRPLEGLIS